MNIINNKKSIRLFIITSMVLCLVTSCKVTKPYQEPTISAATNYYRDVKTTTDSSSIATLSWKEIFTDKNLQKLIEEGIAKNIDLKTAYSRIIQAQANLNQSRMQFLPSVDAYAKTALNNNTQSDYWTNTTGKQQYQLGIQASWEADIWGKLKSIKQSNLARFLQEEANAKAVQTSLVASIASDYYDLLALDQQLNYTKESVKTWQSTVDVMKKLKTADVVTGAAVVQSEASKYAVAVTIPDLEQSIWVTENHLNVLLARTPQPIVRDSIGNQSEITSLQTGLPVQLLTNRPDVRAAELNFRYYFEQTNVAKTFFYPTLSITASTGYASNSLLNLGSWVSNLAGGLLQPIFNQGINKSRLAIAKESEYQAALNFQQTLLSAGQEVSDALSLYKTASDKAKIRKDQLFNLEKSVNFTQQLVRYGSANYTEVLNAQQNLLKAQLDGVNDRLQQLQSTVNLYRALGGGWK